LQDHQTGGAAFLCQLLGKQLDHLVSEGQRNRTSILEEVERGQSEALERLLQGEYMFPPPVQRDLRKEHLKRFQEGLDQAIGLESRQGQRGVGPDRENEMRRLNHALRELLNVDYTTLETLPAARHHINEEFILLQFRAWIRKQASRWSPVVGGSDGLAGTAPE